MNKIKIGLSIPSNYNLDGQLSYLSTSRIEGIENLIDEYWIGDNPYQNNAFINIITLFERISNIKLWTSITSSLYYHPGVLKDICSWILDNYPQQFGLGLAVGNHFLFEDINKQLVKKPVSSFIKYSDIFLEVMRNFYYKFEIKNRIPVATGA